MRIYLNFRLLSQEIIILNDNSILEWNENNNEILYMIYTDSLCKKDMNIDHMRDNYKDIFLCMRDADSECKRDKSEIFLRIFHIDDEFEEVEDNFSWYCNNVNDISCTRIWVYYKKNNKEREIIIRISLSGVENKDIKVIKFEDEFECNYLCSNCGCDFPQFLIMQIWRRS